MTEWFYARNGQQYGPVTFEQLVEIARNGGLDPIQDSVWNASMQGWTPAGQISAIFPIASNPALAIANSANPYAAPQSNWGGAVPADGTALTEIVPGSEVIDPMGCINRAVELTKRQFGDIILVGLVYFGCLMGLGIVFGIIEALPAILARGDAAAQGANTLTITITVISRIVQQFVSIFLQLGLARVGLNLVSGKEVSIGMLFGEGSKFLRALGAMIIFGFAVLIGLLLLIVPGIYIALRYGQFMTAIVDRDLGVMEAFSYSESITTNNRVNLFLLALLSIVAIIVGLIPCGLGLIFLGPVVWLAALVAYRWMQYGAGAAMDHPGTQKPMLSAL